MFSLDSATTICTLRDAIFPSSRSVPDGDGSCAGIVFTLDARIAVFKGDKEYRRSAMVFIALCGNTNVFVAIEPNDSTRHLWGRYATVPMDAWVNTSNHDSCWRSDGMRPLSELYFRFANEINDELTEEDRVAPKDMHQSTSLGFLMSRPFEFVQMRHERLPGSAYRRKLLSIEPHQ